MSKVYIIGAGPGDIGYLTVRAKDVLALAEVLIYDALVDRGLLNLVPRDCVLVDVGKRLSGDGFFPDAGHGCRAAKLVDRQCDMPFSLIEKPPRRPPPWRPAALPV